MANIMQDMYDQYPWCNWSGIFCLQRLSQQAKWYALKQACTLAKGRTADISTDSRYASGVAHDFGMLCKQSDFLTSSRNKIKSGQDAKELLDGFSVLLLAFVKIPGHSKAKGNNFADILSGNGTFKGTNPLPWSKETFPPNNNLEKLAREAQQ